MIEQFYTGEINFPEINGVDEGSLAISLISFLTGYYGNEMWNTKLDLSFLPTWYSDLYGENNTISRVFVTGLIVLLYPYGMYSVYNIYKKR